MTKPPTKDGETGPDSDRAESAPSYIGTATAEQRVALRGGNGNGGGGPGLDARVAKLEAHTEHMQADLSEIRVLLGGLGNQLRHLPTKQDMTNNVLTMVVIGLTVLLLGIGGIIGGLGWIQDRGTAPAKEAPAPAPMIFQLPPQTVVAPQPTAPIPPTATRPKK